MSSKLEPAIWSRDTSQRASCFDRCQLIITWMSNIKEEGMPLCVSLSIFQLEYGRHLARLRRRRRRPRANAPTNNTASHDNHEKISSWVTFSFLCENGAPLGDPSGHWSYAIIKGSLIPTSFLILEFVTNHSSYQNNHKEGTQTLML